jgi:hypothetical protein
MTTIENFSDQYKNDPLIMFKDLYAYSSKELNADNLAKYAFLGITIATILSPSYSAKFTLSTWRLAMRNKKLAMLIASSLVLTSVLITIGFLSYNHGEIKKTDGKKEADVKIAEWVYELNPLSLTMKDGKIATMLAVTVFAVHLNHQLNFIKPLSRNVGKVQMGIELMLAGGLMLKILKNMFSQQQTVADKELTTYQYINEQTASSIDQLPKKSENEIKPNPKPKLGLHAKSKFNKFAGFINNNKADIGLIGLIAGKNLLKFTNNEINFYNIYRNHRVFASCAIVIAISAVLIDMAYNAKGSYQEKIMKEQGQSVENSLNA